ncbi:MAG: class I SAM-dependent methyltransferase [Acidimicrobiia bacterium]|nr:class I SAM-dependent methyltransferase [Acidimicrobiia bacterium]
MPEGWEWDETLFRGAAAHYAQGRIPYPPRLHDAFAAHADLSGSPRLLDVGCGPGTVALRLADLFTEVVGVDPDADMLAEAARLAEAQGVTNGRWVQRRAEDLPADLGSFRYATFAQSFHWMEREVVAATVFDVLEPGGAFVHVNTQVEDVADRPSALPHPPPPVREIERLRESYLGPVRRAGQGVLASGTPGAEPAVLEAAGFEAPRVVRIAGLGAIDRSAGDVVDHVLSQSGSAPHLFGPRLAHFEADLRAVLAEAAPDGRFTDWSGDVALFFFRRP